jgi:hypothetical protein
MGAADEAETSGGLASSDVAHSASFPRRSTTIGDDVTGDSILGAVAVDRDYLALAAWLMLSGR